MGSHEIKIPAQKRKELTNKDTNYRKGKKIFADGVLIPRTLKD